MRGLRGVALVGLVLAGCAHARPGPGSGDDAPAAASVLPAGEAGDADPVPPDPSPGCLRGAPGPGGARSFVSGNLTRHFLLRLPPGGPPRTPAPLVLNFHGLAESPGMQEMLTRMTELAGRRGVLLVYPEGLGWSWNAGACCGPAVYDAAGDVQFVRELIARLGNEFCIDRRRVFSTGMSNGGLFSYRLACEASDLIAAIAPVAAVQVVPACAPARPVPVLAFHGTKDNVVPYAGGVFGFRSVPEVVRGWAERDGCSASFRESYRRGEVHCAAAQGCARGSDVLLCTVEGGGHTWPGGMSVPWLGHTTDDVDASAQILEFFARHPLR